VAEDEPEDTRGQSRDHSDTSVHPHDCRITGGGDECLRDSGTDGGGEEVERLDEGLHARWGLGVGVFETGDRNEDLSQTDEHVSRSLNGDVHVVGERAVSIHASRALSRAAITGPGLVDDVLDDSGVHEAEGAEHESNGDTSDRLELDLELAEDGVNHHVENRDENNDRDGVKVLHQIVGHTVALHLTGLRDEVAGELRVADPEDRVETEDLASHESTLQLLDEVVVPWDRLGLSIGGAPRWLGSVGVARDNHQTDGLESIGDDRSLRRADDVVFLRQNQDDDADAEHAEAHNVSSPETLVLLHERSGEERETSNVDASVEHHVDSLECDRRVDDDTLASLCDGGDSQPLARVLVRNKRRNVRLDATSSESDNDDGGDIASKSGASLDRRRERGRPEDDQTNPVDHSEDQNCVVLSKVLIGNDGTKNGSNVAEELEEHVQASSSSVSKTKTSRAIAAVRVVVDVVLEETLAACCRQYKLTSKLACPPKTNRSM
jgi:hypothetical protein